jgi:hypothetical protein
VSVWTVAAAAILGLLAIAIVVRVVVLDSRTHR